jgi:trimethylamine--corrinoid protein Co-methyltransferase
VEIVPVTLMGLIAPVTLVGATVMHVADVLAGLTMAQLVKPGTPVLFGGAPAAFHMQTAQSPMAAIESLYLDTAYVAVAKHLGLPTQSYMALSEGKFIDAQAGAETFGSALLAALSGVNSVSGPGMLDYVLTFSLEKLVLDNELCGQALHFVRDYAVKEDLPTVDLVRQLLNEKHLLTSEHTLKYWPRELYLPGPIYDRMNREQWAKEGGRDLGQRMKAEVESRLAAFVSPETDPRVEAELLKLIRSGMSDPAAPLPEVLPPATGQVAAPSEDRRAARRRARELRAEG